MISLSLAEIAQIVGGTVEGDPRVRVTGPAFLDSRTPEPGGLFVAFHGERVDGHEYAAGAVAAGAAAVLGSRPTGVPSVLVDDVQAALQRLAETVLRRRRRADRERSPGCWSERDDAIAVIAVTGSQGKTSAKDMLARVLGDAAPTIATSGSFNNELGLPLTVLRLRTETRFLVLEMGARGVGHLSHLCAIAPPDVALVLNVGKAHLGEFGSQENIALAKGEIVAALNPAHGVAVLNADDPFVTGMNTRVEPAGDVETVRFGTGADADVRLADVTLDELGRPSFDLGHEGRVAHVSLRLVGGHQATNAAAVAATALAAGLRLDDVVRSLEGIDTLSRWRMEIRERSDGLVVLNDAYNANPDSMRAAVETLARVGERAGRRTIAVLGAMRELGPGSDAEHRAVGLLTEALGIDVVVLLGDARPAYDALVEAGADPPATHHVDTLDEAAQWLRDNVAGSDVVLVKASRSEGLERLADALLGEGESA